MRKNTAEMPKYPVQAEAKKPLMLKVGDTKHPVPHRPLNSSTLQSTASEKLPTTRLSENGELADVQDDKVSFSSGSIPLQFRFSSLIVPFQFRFISFSVPLFANSVAKLLFKISVSSLSIPFHFQFSSVSVPFPFRFQFKLICSETELTSN